MKNILLIDDESDFGWKEVLELTVFSGLTLSIATSEDEAIAKLNSVQYELILLDLRFGQKDHEIDGVEEFGGFKILTESIRNALSSLNFPTPVLLFTASNKIWHINALLENGADDYYIKEHPGLANDVEFSRANYQRLLNSISQLTQLGANRRIIWEQIIGIEKKIFHFIHNRNIRTRISGKLKIGYATLFSRPTTIETKVLLKSNELLAFVIFWSILEEIVKDSFKDNWVKFGKYEGTMKLDTWVFRNDKVLSQPVDTKSDEPDQILVGMRYDKVEEQWTARNTVLTREEKGWEYNKLTGRIDLSYQVNAFCLLYKNMEPYIVKAKFIPLRDFRNKTAYTHSSVKSILDEELSSPAISEEAFKKCIEMLRFLNEILN